MPRPNDIQAAEPPTLRTRGSLLNRLRDLDDHVSWAEFSDVYWRFIFRVAVKSGLTEWEAEEVVQNTLIAAARKMPTFTYDAARDSFKGWLLKITYYRISDQFRQRRKAAARRGHDSTGEGIPDAPEIEAISDPRPSELEKLWDAEWEENLVRAGLDRLKRKIQPAHYEIYYLHMICGRPATQVAKTLKVPVAQVYLVKSRVSRMFKKELQAIRAAEPWR